MCRGVYPEFPNSWNWWVTKRIISFLPENRIAGEEFMPWDYLKSLQVRFRQIEKEEQKYKKQSKKIYDPQNPADVLLYQRIVSHQKRFIKIKNISDDLSCLMCGRFTNVSSWIISKNTGMCRVCFNNGFSLENNDFVVKKKTKKPGGAMWWKPIARWSVDRKKTMSALHPLSRSITFLGHGYLQAKYISNELKEELEQKLIVLGVCADVFTLSIRYTIDGKRLKKARLASHLSQRQLADNLNWSVVYQKRLESKDASTISEQTFKKMRRYL